MNKTLVDESKSLSFENVNAVMRRVTHWIENQTDKDMILDFSKVEYIDSAGVAMLVQLHKLSQTRYNKIVNMNISPIIQQMLKFYEIDKFLEYN